jgi:flagellin
MGSIINKMDEHIETLEEKSITNNDYIGKIKDADIAKESTALISTQIQQQAAVSMLAQCNSKVNRVLEVLWQG